MLSKRLTELRKEKGVTQKDMSLLLGITRPAYTAYEMGKRQPDYETLIKLADYFNVTIDYLLGRTEFRRARLVTKEELEEFLNSETIKALEKDEIEIGIATIGDLDFDTKREIIALLRKHGYLKKA